MANQQRMSQIADLKNQWEQLVGYSIAVGDDIMNMLFDSSVQTLYDLGNWMDTHGQHETLGGVDYGNYPWARFGMTSTEYHSKLMGYMTAFADLTGTAQPPPGFLERALQQDQGQMTAGEFRSWIVTQKDFTNMYGWVKYGLDYQQFQQQKIQMAQAIGTPDISNEQAIAQLQYFHQVQGAQAMARPTRTLTQEEKKQVNIGPSGSVVR